MEPERFSEPSSRARRSHTASLFRTPEPSGTTRTTPRPGKRVELAGGPFEEGEEIAIEGLPYDRGQGESEQALFATVRVRATAPSRVRAPDTPAQIEPLAAPDAEPTRTINMKALMHGG